MKERKNGKRIPVKIDLKLLYHDNLCSGHTRRMQEKGIYFSSLDVTFLVGSSVDRLITLGE